MNGQWVFIEPTDVWLFRDNKPFTAQQNFVARGQFPPTPMTMQGVIRTHYLETQLQRDGRTWEDYRHGNVSDAIIQRVGLPQIGERPATFGNLRITGPFVAHTNSQGQVQRLIKAPLDLLYNQEDIAYKLLSPSPASGFETNVPFDGWRPLTGGGEGFKEANGWLTETQFHKYLAGDKRDFGRDFGSLTNEEDIFKIEDRVGLALDYGRRANAESMFYRAEFTRVCEGIGLLVHVNLDIFENETGFVNIGGESRSGYYRIVKSYQPAAQQRSGRVRIVLLTPAYFSNGWQPGNDDWSPWVGDGKLVSVVIGKPHLISGWDVAHNRPKPLRAYVPAGSVFFFEDADITGVPFTESPSDSPDQGAMGFGTFAVGVW
jgi:CRISPR-associated protein Cmr3